MGHMLLDGDTPENRERIQGFLALQDKDSKADYEIHFLNGNQKMYASLPIVLMILI